MNSKTLRGAGMCRAFFRLAFLAVLILTIQPIGHANAVSDSDWNISFYDDCGMPSVNSTKWLTEDGNRFIRFTLNNRDIGLCSRDNTSRGRAPYWERAELKQSSRLYFNKQYELTFQARFVEGFLSERETFFQIHAHSEFCSPWPPIMLKSGNSRIEIGYEARASVKVSDIFIRDLIGKWTKFKLVFDTSKNPKISLYLNEKKIFDDFKFGIDRCGVPHFKFGIYRPGNKENPIPRSVVDFDKFQLKVLDEDFQHKELNYCFDGGFQKNGSYERQIKLADLWLEGPSSDMRVYAVTPPNKCEEGHEEIAEGQYEDLKARIDSYKKD